MVVCWSGEDDCDALKMPGQPGPQSSRALRGREVEHSIGPMIGAILNAVGIAAGGAVGLARRRPLSEAHESFFKVGLGAFTVFYGLRLTWQSLSGTLTQILKELAVVVLALMLGKLAGQLLRLQRLSNHLGRGARKGIEAAAPNTGRKAGDGFKVCAVLFCAAPLGIVGAVQDGVSGYYYPLAVKAVMDGLAAMGFARIFGGTVMLAAVPVLAMEGTVTLVCARLLAPWLGAHGLVEALNATGGLLVFSVALVILGLKRIELADYLPSLVFAPLLAWLVR